MAGNVAIRQDSNGNFKADKAKSLEKIDGIAGTLNAFVLAILEMDTTVVTEGESAAIA